jgi:hypothetical protein
MSEIARAETQYGDLSGDVQIDGHDGVFLQQLFARVENRPAGYSPVGLLFYAERMLDPTESPIVSILAADLSETSLTFQEYLDHARSNNSEIPVFEFVVEISFVELLTLIKRLSVFVSDTNGVPLKILRNN